MSTRVNTQRHEEAAEWFVMFQQDEDLSAAGLRAWEQWIADPDNRKSFAAMIELSSHVEGMELPPLSDAQELATDDFDGLEPVAAWLSRRKQITLPDAQKDSNVHVLRPMPAAAQPSLLQSRSDTPAWHRKLWHPRFAAVAAAVALVAMLGVLSYSLVRSGLVSESRSYQTATGEHRSIRLTDGSMVELGARSVLRVRFANAQRRVFIDAGEVFFDVAKNAERPFVAQAGGLELTALGTAFNVRRTTGRVVVSVQEGRVRAAVNDAPGLSETLTRGQQLRYDASGVSPVNSVDTERVVAWREGRLQYLYEPLQEVVDDINRYSQRQVTLDERAARLRFTGTVFRENVDAFVNQLPGVFPLAVVEADADHIVFRMSAAQQ